MGLERISAVMQHVHSNYEIDLFQTLLKAAAKLTGTQDHNHTSLKVIADHIRSCSFLVVDGVIPSNEGRGYVLRRIIRRALRHGHHLGVKDVFFHKLVATLADVMGDAYPELVQNRARIAEVLLGEEQQFSRTLENGMVILNDAIAALKGKVIPGDVVFKLYDTYGFPVDLTADIARERGLTVDSAGFDKAMEVQKQQARAASRFEADEALAISDNATSFEGYEQLESQGTVLALYRDGKKVPVLNAGEQGIVLLDTTAFYAESGGQVGDTGQLFCKDSTFTVTDTRKQGSHYLHHGRVESGSLKTGQPLTASVAPAIRQATMLNHSATHLMHAALRQVLGEHVTQKGSLVHPDYLRFDFSHNKALTDAELEQIENLVNAQILANHEVGKRSMSIDEARKLGAMALFGEKYGDVVRVVSMGNNKLKDESEVFSIELCGGTHVQRTGDIGLFRITAEQGIAAGVRRIEAVTGMRAIEHVREQEKRLIGLAALVKTSPDQVVDKVQQLVANQRALEKELQQLKSKVAAAAGADLASQAQDIKGIKVLATEVQGIDSKALRDTAEQLRNKLGSGVVVLAVNEGGKVSLVVAVSKDLTDRIKAGELVGTLASHVGGKGGGRPDMAMAGGTNPAGLAAALAAVGPAISGLI
jgi:alanyl-tRNA synthetase